MPTAFVILSLLAALVPGASPEYVPAAVSPGPISEYVPAGDEAYHLDLEVGGYVNGAMDPDRLMSYRGCSLERDAAYMYALLLEAAQADGIRLSPVDCYRSYGNQKAAYNRRCPESEVEVYAVDPVTGEKAPAGTKTVRVCTGPPTARPGYSNHGWGRAVDFGDGYGVLGCSDRALRWLQGNAYRFGWVHPRWAWCDMSTREPWHWEWAGVTDPTLVGYYEFNEELIQIVR
jgi:D-alanyl-D-alanine carboxypeptidase